ncbi:MAG: hypothetical protein FD128_1012, partial [Hyphomonadaceae bacterium]
MQTIRSFGIVMTDLSQTIFPKILLAIALLLAITFFLVSCNRSDETPKSSVNLASAKWGITAEDWQNQSPTHILSKANAETKFQDILQAAQNQNVEAMLLCGLAYEWGIGVAKNEADAAHWYRAAAAAGNPIAMLNLGTMHAEGRGFPKNAATATKWFLDAANAGNAQGMVFYGAMLANGEGAAKDEATAATWFQKAAEAGNPSGMVIFGNALAKGSGIAKDEREAADWYRKAAEAGDAFGKFQLGNLYASNASIARNLIEANENWQNREAQKLWREVAASGGNAAKDAVDALKRVYGIDCVKVGEN